MSLKCTIVALKSDKMNFPEIGLQHQTQLNIMKHTLYLTFLFLLSAFCLFSCQKRDKSI